MRRNCWEAHSCGEAHLCPAYPSNGRTCYAVTGTFCRGQIQGAYVKKIEKCRESCSFFREVMEGEGVRIDRKSA